MPILIQQFEWTQTDEMIRISIPLENVCASKLDVFTSANYIKVHHAPHLCELFLHAAIDVTESRCEVVEGSGGLVLTLRKASAEAWPLLQEEPISKEQKVILRQQALDKAHDSAKEHRKKLTEYRDELQKLTIEENIKLNDREHSQMEKNRLELTSSALQEISRWQEQEQASLLEHSSLASLDDQQSGIQQEPTPAEEFVPATSATPPRTRPSLQGVKIFPPVKPKVPVVPPPREHGEIVVDFTSRNFPTPKRESTNADEQEWLRKQMEARKASGYSKEDLKPEETDIDWIKEKADSFLGAGNFLGAEAAYSHAISLGYRLPALYCNRAAAHLALGNLHKTVEDCSTGLELLTPETASNAKSRARCHARRGAALCGLENAHLAIPDLQAAQALCPEDKKLGIDLAKAERLARKETEDTDSSNSSESEDSNSGEAK